MFDCLNDSFPALLQLLSSGCVLSRPFSGSRRFGWRLRFLGLGFFNWLYGFCGDLRRFWWRVLRFWLGLALWGIWFTHWFLWLSLWFFHWFWHRFLWFTHWFLWLRLWFFHWSVYWLLDGFFTIYWLRNRSSSLNHLRWFIRHIRQPQHHRKTNKEEQRYYEQH
jgi:hypothetical protein